MVDIRATREEFDRDEVSDVRRIWSSENFADGMSQLAPCRSITNMTRTGRFKSNVQQ